jgi:hypothetical protein
MPLQVGINYSMCASNTTMTVQTSELYPTEIRAIGHATCAIVGRLGCSK